MTWNRQGGESKRLKLVTGLPSRRARDGVELHPCGACGRLHAWESPAHPETGAALKDELGCSTKCTNELLAEKRKARREAQAQRFLAWKKMNEKTPCTPMSTL